MSDIIARRAFTPLYIWLDIAFLIIFMALLFRRKRYMALISGIVMGIFYMVVDYGVFHLLTGSRSISAGYSMFWVLLWMSISYGFTNFAWIWLWLDRDPHLKEWTLLILSWWFCAPHISETFAQNGDLIVIQRTTGAYHGWMAIILFVSYLGVIVYNLYQRRPDERINLGRLLMIGICVQLGWETALLLGGVRSAGFDFAQKLITLIVNSLLETNLGMPLAFVIYIAITRRIASDLKPKRPVLAFHERMGEYNRATENT